MGRQRLPAGGRGVHHPWRRRSGSVRRTIFIDCRHRPICSCLVTHRHSARRDDGGRCACPAGARRRLRRIRHACRGDRSRAGVKAGGGNRRLDRFPDARFQHRPVGGRDHHALRRMALQFLAERCCHGARSAHAVAASCNPRTSHEVDGLGGTRRARRLHGVADFGVAGVGAFQFGPAGRDRRARVGNMRFRHPDLDRATASSAPRRLRSVFESKFCRRLRPGLSPHVRHHDAPALLQFICAGAGRP